MPLGGAIPSPELLPGAKLSRIVGSLAREHTAETISYDPVPGSLTLRREISRRSLDWGCHLSSDEFIVVNGATEGVYLALRAVTKPGDTVLIESPTYYGLVHILNQMGLKTVAVPASARDGLSIDITPGSGGVTTAATNRRAAGVGVRRGRIRRRSTSPSSRTWR